MRCSQSRPRSFGPPPQKRWRFVRDYLTVVTSLNLLWEIGHLPLYTIWNSAGIRGSLLAAIHCTVGDLIIATVSLGVAVLFAGRNWPYDGYLNVATVTVLLGVAYTVFSEWLNIEVQRTWAYTPMMPRLPWIGTGISPLAQWVVIPSAAFFLLRYRASYTR